MLYIFLHLRVATVRHSFELAQLGFTLRLFCLTCLRLSHVLRALLDELSDKVQQRLVLIDLVRVERLHGRLERDCVYLDEVEGFTTHLDMLHNQIEVFSTLSDSLARRANLDAMLDGIAAFLGQVGVETGGSLIAAGVAREVLLEEEVGRLRVRTAVVHLSADKLLIASHALEFLQACKHLPEDFLPADLLLS